MKKILSILLTALLLLTIAVSCSQDMTVDQKIYDEVENFDIFVLNGKGYRTLQAAVDAFKAGSNAKAVAEYKENTIYLTANAEGLGAEIDNLDEALTIDFQGYTYSFTEVTAKQGSEEGKFGLSIKNGSSVVLKGMSDFTLRDKADDLTMVYIEGENSSLVIEDAPVISVEETQYAFWVANGAKLTIGKEESNEPSITGKIAATGGDTAASKPTITVKAKAEINGSVEATKASVKIEGNSIVTGSIEATNTSVTFDSAEQSTVSLIIEDATVEVKQSVKVTEFKVESTSTKNEVIISKEAEVKASNVETAKQINDLLSDDSESSATPEVVGHVHDFSVHIPAVPATCTETGWMEYNKCSTCGEFDPDHNKQLVPALGHEASSTIVDYFKGDDGKWYANCKCVRYEDCHQLVAVETEAVVASIGKVGYTSVQAAIDAAKENDTVVILKDSTADITIPANATIKLDLGGFTLGDLESENPTTLTNNGNLSIIGENGGIFAGGVVVGSDSDTLIDTEDGVILIISAFVDGTPDLSIRNAWISFKNSVESYIQQAFFNSVTEESEVVPYITSVVIPYTDTNDFHRFREIPEEVSFGTTKTSLYDFAQIVNEGTTWTENTATLLSDVSLSETLKVLGSDMTAYMVWTPAGTTENPFSGVFDGRGYAIKNLTIEGGEKIGLFKYAKNATFKNIRFEKASITDAVQDGAVLLGYAFGNLTIDNVVIDSDSEVSGTKKVGGLVGTIDNRLNNGGRTYITNCVNSATITSPSRVGALVANIYCWNTQGDDLLNNSFDDGHLYYFENCTNTGLLTETGTDTSGVGLVSYINLGTRHGGYTETYLMQETFVFKNCNNDYEKMSITKEDGNKGYYIGTYTNAGRIVIEKNGESYSNRIVGGLSSGRYIFKVNNDLYGFRSETADDGSHLPLSIENSPVDLGLVISRVNQQEAIDYFKETSGYTICYIDEGKVYPINANTASFDDNYDLLIEGGFLVIGNSYYSITVEPFVKTGKTVKVTHSEQSTSEYTYQILDTVN